MQRSNIIIKNYFFIFAHTMSLDKIKYWKNRHTEHADQDVVDRYRKITTYHPQQETLQTVPKLQRVLSSSGDSHSSRRKKAIDREQKNFSNLKLYNKLNHKLDEIKETLIQSLVAVGHRRQKNVVKRKEKVITEVSEHDPRGKSRNRNYYDVLDHIAEVRARNRKSNLAEPDPKMPSIPANEERTLFYGIDFIDGVQFKIKLKLSKTHYYLFAKNNHAKIMIEIGYAEYMKLHIGEFRGNPCAIFRCLAIKGEKMQLSLKGSPEKKVVPSLKSYVGYY